MVNGNKSRDVDINYISNTPNRLINAKTDNYLHLLGSMNNSILDSKSSLLLNFRDSLLGLHLGSCFCRYKVPSKCTFWVGSK